jgi:hypothetical protein
MHKRSWCRLKVPSKATIKLHHGVRKWSRVRLHSSQRLRAVSESWHLPDGAKSAYSSADNLRFNACTNMEWLTISWCAACMILMAYMTFDHRCQLTPDLNHNRFSTCNISNFSTCNLYKHRDAFSKCLYSCAVVCLPRKKISSSFTQPSEDPESLAIFQPAKSVWEIQINSSDAISCQDRLGK